METTSRISRRHFLEGTASASAATVLLAACGTSSPGAGSSGGSGEVVKFWDMPWGNAEYNKVGAALVGSYKPRAGLPRATYQTIPWLNFAATFGSAIASGTGPAVSSGGGFQAFVYANEGKIAYADELVAKLKQDGTLDDFLPGLVELFHTANGYVAVPWQLDIRVWLYNKTVFGRLNLAPPATWDEAVTTARALKKGGYPGFAFSAGPGSLIGYQQLLTLMINNGGGLFNAANELDCVTPRNIEAMEYVIALVRDGLVSPSAVSYTDSDAMTQWQKGNFVMGIGDAGYNIDTGNQDITVMPEPLAGPHGDKITLVYINNLMMYKESPSLAGAQAFLEWYLKRTGIYWQKKLLDGLPVLKSITQTPKFKEQTNLYVSVEKWFPVAKTFAAAGDKLSAQLGVIDGGPQVIQFAQRIISGQDAKTSLQTLQTQLESVLHS